MILKKSGLSIIIIVLLGLVMFVTCPKENDHKNAICLAINKAVDEKLGDNSLFSLTGIVNFAGKWVIKKGANVFIDSYVEVDSYGLLSVGRYTFEGHNDVISVGMFNHVFTMSKDDILEELEKQGL